MQISIVYDGITAPANNERLRFLITALEQQNPSPEKARDLYEGWHRILQTLKETYHPHQPEKQRQMLHEAVVRCSVLDYVLYGRQIQVVESTLH